MQAAWQWLKDFANSLFTGWLFTEKGTAYATVLWGAITAVFAYFTNSLQEHYPLSIWVAFSVGLFLALHLCRTFNGIFTRRKTRKPTYLEYTHENGILEMVDKSNIYKVPHYLNIEIQLVRRVPAEAINQGGASVEYSPVLVKHPRAPDGEGANSSPILVTFERPIHAEYIRIEQISGKKPRTQFAVLDDGFSYFGLQDLYSPSRFKVIFQ